MQRSGDETLRYAIQLKMEHYCSAYTKQTLNAMQCNVFYTVTQSRAMPQSIFIVFIHFSLIIIQPTLQRVSCSGNISIAYKVSTFYG